MYPQFHLLKTDSWIDSVKLRVRRVLGENSFLPN